MASAPFLFGEPCSGISFFLSLSCVGCFYGGFLAWLGQLSCNSLVEKKSEPPYAGRPGFASAAGHTDKAVMPPPAHGGGGRVPGGLGPL